MRQEQAPQLQWLDALSFREIGATPEVFYHTGISEAFDCLIFIRKHLGFAPAAILNPGRMPHPAGRPRYFPPNSAEVISSGREASNQICGAV